MEPAALRDLASRINKRVERLLANAPQPGRRDHPYYTKIIHDPIWGTNRFLAWEVAILDTPLLQKLRNIRQTGLASLVYPTSLHTRFDHTLGVTAAVHKVFHGLYDNGYITRDLYGLADGADDRLFRERVHDMYHQLRLAALLHDTGHSLLSHTSEQVYKLVGEMPFFQKTFNNYYKVNSGAGEIFSFYICKSPALKRFVSNLKPYLGHADRINSARLADHLDIAADFIIGRATSESNVFCANIINGPYDVDKLDYIRRDSYFTGIVLNYDLDRFLSQIMIKYCDVRSDDAPFSKAWQLVLPKRAVNVLEQIVISKFMLYSYLYHHHKVLAAEYQAIAILEDIWPDLGVFDAMGFIELNDIAYHNAARNNRQLGEISRRNLLFTAVRLNMWNLKKHLEEEKQVQLRLQNATPEKRKPGLGIAKHRTVTTIMDAKESILSGEFIRFFREYIFKLLKDGLERDPAELDHRKLVIVFPQRIKKEEFEKIVVLDDDDDPIPLGTAFPINAWEESYYQTRWRGYVFCPAEDIDLVAEAFEKCLSAYGIVSAKYKGIVESKKRRVSPAESLSEDLPFFSSPA